MNWIRKQINREKARRLLLSHCKGMTKEQRLKFCWEMVYYLRRREAARQEERNPDEE